MMNQLRTARVIVGAWLALTAGSVEASPSEGPARIVTLGAPVTETVAALGCADQVVGIDATSREIIARPDIKNLGFYKRITATGVLSVRANLLIATHDSGFPATFDQLQRAGVKVVRLPKVDSAASAIQQIEVIAEAVGKVSEGAALIELAKSQLARLKEMRPDEKDRPRTLFIYARGAGAMLVGGRETVADAMIELAGGVNVAAGFEGFKPLSPEALIAEQPEVLLLTAHGFDALGGQAGLRAHPVLSRTPAVVENRVVVREALELLSFGPRFAERALALAPLLKPSGPKPSADSRPSVD